MTTLLRRLLIVISALASMALALVACSGGADTLAVGFSPFYDQVSYNASSDPDADGYNTHLGYEADLLTALESMDGLGFSFERRPIPEWPGIWLKSATDEFDIVGGGITIREARTRNAAGDTVVAFTNGHIAFRQSLLVRSGDAERMATHERLTGDMIIGVYRDTTGEGRLLQLTGLTDANGTLAAGARVATPNGDVVADGSDAYTITPASASEILTDRSHLYPPDETMPQVMYLPDDVSPDAVHEMLLAGVIDGRAGEEIENNNAVHGSNGNLSITALDDLVEYGGFTVDADNTELLARLNEGIDYLTDNRRIGYAEWRADPTVFMQRAEQWRK